MWDGSAPPPFRGFPAARLLLLFVEETVLERRLRRTLVGRRTRGTRPRRSGLPSGEHYDRPVAVDDDEPGKKRPVRALELDARGWPGRIAQPVEDRLGAR